MKPDGSAFRIDLRQLKPHIMRRPLASPLKLLLAVRFAVNA